VMVCTLSWFWDEAQQDTHIVDKLDIKSGDYRRGFISVRLGV
jgi:hypothetical protein